MIRRRTLEIITLGAIIVFIALVVLVNNGGNHEFRGSDDIASEKISGMQGVPAGSIRPIIPQFVPPSTEIETTLLALQAAVGGFVLGAVFGYWLGRKKQVVT
jgi:cobalt/nickel transport protein